MCDCLRENHYFESYDVVFNLGDSIHSLQCGHLLPKPLSVCAEGKDLKNPSHFFTVEGLFFYGNAQEPYKVNNLPRFLKSNWMEQGLRIFPVSHLKPAST